MRYGGDNVKLTEISIKGLYGIFDYEIPFFDNVTFIHGINGCGKTTILEIISSIIAGNISRLKNWKFDKIKLSYLNNKNESKSILIDRKDDSTNKYEGFFIINFNSVEYSLPIIDDFLLPIDSKIILDTDELSSKIKEEFPVIYIPLLRNKNLIKDRYSLFADVDKETIDSLDDVLSKEMKELLNFKTKISHIENELSDKFLSELMGYLAKPFNIDIITKFIQEKIKESYSAKNLEDKIKKLKETLNELEKSYGLNLKQDSTLDELPTILQRHKTNRRKTLSPELILGFCKLLQMQQIISLYEDFKKQKTELKKPLINFLTVINDFYNTGRYGKKIKFSTDGNCILIQKNIDTKEHILSEYDLSSGEKQIFILLANLVINLSNDTQEGIYIIDEPELSLHMEWQMKLVDSIFKINSKVQLIFATHSPDIISHYDTHAIRLI